MGGAAADSRSKREFTLYNIKHLFGVICYTENPKNSENPQSLDIPTNFGVQFVQFDDSLAVGDFVLIKFF